jgi:hypothetical protein
MPPNNLITDRRIVRSKGLYFLSRPKDCSNFRDGEYELRMLDLVEFLTIPKIEQVRVFQHVKMIELLSVHPKDFCKPRKRIAIHHYYYVCQSKGGVSLIDF